MDDPKDRPEPQDEQERPDEAALASCSCTQDPFSELPAELRPRQRSWKEGLRKVTCPGCGMNYWTSRKTDLCPNCEKKGVRLPEPKLAKEDENAAN
jgi:hypothetical protein